MTVNNIGMEEKIEEENKKNKKNLRQMLVDRQVRI